MLVDKIGSWTQAQLRRYIVNEILTDPGALPKALSAANVLPKANDGEVPVWNAATNGWVSSSQHKVTTDNLSLTALTFPCTGTTSFTNTLTDVPGCTWTVTASGSYLVWGAFDIQFPVNTGSDIATGHLNVNGVDQSAQAVKKDDNTASGPRGHVGQTWLITPTAGQIVKLQVFRAGAAGTAQVIIQHTTMTILRVV